MSRKKDERDRRKAEKQSLDAEFDARPKPIFPPAGPNVRQDRLGFLQPDEEWFSNALIQEEVAVRRALDGKEVLSVIANDLRAQGFRPRVDKPGYMSDDQFFVVCYWHELLATMWPEELAHSLWDKDRELSDDDADNIIRFLEVNPFFFRSGYVKPRAIKRLKRCPLTKENRVRIAGILGNLVEAGWGVNMGGWMNLIFLADQDAAWEVVRKGVDSPLYGSRQRAVLIAIGLKGYPNPQDFGPGRYPRYGQKHKFKLEDVRRWLEERAEDTKV